MGKQILEGFFNVLLLTRGCRAAAFLALYSLLLAPCSPAQAQQPEKVARIGYFAVPPPRAVAARIDAFRHGMRELGYVEGKNFVLESRYAEGKLARLPALAAELVRLQVDVILSAGPANTRAAKEATKTIPIVMAQDDDPVGSEFIASLARPGGNITGLSSLAREISGKRLELLKEIIPQLSRVAILGTSTSPGNAQGLREAELAADVYKIRIQYQDVLSLGDIEAAFRAVRQGRAEALFVLGGPVLNSDRAKIVALAAKNRLPATYNVPDFVEAGGLMTYGVSFVDLYRRAAIYVDKILKGAKPAELPVEQPKKFELIINLKAAKQIGLTIPPNVLARADKVIR
jgi:putative ABC transport system substrate-binding protein